MLFLAVLGLPEANEGDSYTHAHALFVCGDPMNLPGGLILIDGAMMTMAKTNRAGVSPGGTPGGYWRPFSGFWQPQHSSRVSPAKSLSQRVGIKEWQRQTRWLCDLRLTD